MNKEKVVSFPNSPSKRTGSVKPPSDKQNTSVLKKDPVLELQEKLLNCNDPKECKELVKSHMRKMFLYEVPVLLQNAIEAAEKTSDFLAVMDKTMQYAGLPVSEENQLETGARIAASAIATALQGLAKITGSEVDVGSFEPEGKGFVNSEEAEVKGSPEATNKWSFLNG